MNIVTGLSRAAGRLGVGVLAVLPLALAGPAAGLPSPGHAGQARGQLTCTRQAPPGDDWPSFGYDPQATRDNTAEKALTPASVHRLRLGWSTSSPAHTLDTLNQGPAVAGGVVYQQILIENPKALEDRIIIEALNACSGSLQWRYPSPWESIFALDTGDQTVAGGRVFSPFTAGDGVQELVALSLSGHLIWSYPGANMGEGPVVVSGGVVYTTSYQAAFAFDAATGRLLWTIPGEFWGLAAADGTVYLNTATGTQAVTAAAGKLLWTRANPGADCGPCSLAVSGGRVFSLGLVTIQALNARTGTVIWQANRPTTGAMSAPAIGSNALLLTTVTGGLYAYNTSTGARLWFHPRLKTINNSSVPAVADGVVYAGTEDGQVIAFSAGTGAALWHARPSTQELSSAAITDGHLYISTTFTGATYAYGLH